MGLKCWLSAWNVIMTLFIINEFEFSSPVSLIKGQTIFYFKKVWESFSFETFTLKTLWYNAACNGQSMFFMPSIDMGNKPILSKHLVRFPPNLLPIQSLFMESKQPGLLPKQITRFLWPSLCWHSTSLDKTGTKSDLCKRKQRTTFLSPCSTDLGLKHSNKTNHWNMPFGVLIIFSYVRHAYRTRIHTHLFETG